MVRWWRLLAFAAGAAVFALLVIRSGPALLLATMRSAGWVILPIVVMWGVTYACNTQAWRLLVPGGAGDLTFGRAFVITVSSFALNYATPVLSVGGEPAKVAAAARWLGPRRAFGSVVGFRLLHAVAQFIVYLLALVPAAVLLPHTPAFLIGIGLAALLISATIVFFLSRHREGVFELIVRWLARLPLPCTWLERLAAHKATFELLDQELASVYHDTPGHFWQALAWEVAARFISTLEFVVILMGLGYGVDLVKGFVVANFSSIVLQLLFFIPFELGAKEGGVYLIFRWLGLAPALGTSAGLLSRIRELVWMAIGLVLLLLSHRAGWIAPAPPTAPEQGQG